MTAYTTYHSFVMIRNKHIPVPDAVYARVVPPFLSCWEKQYYISNFKDFHKLAPNFI